MTQIITEDIALNYTEKLLKVIRDVIQKSKLNTDRLPKWIDYVEADIGIYSNSLLLQFQQSTYSEDRLNFVGETDSFMSFFTSGDFPSRSPTPSLGRKRGEMAGRSFINNIAIDFGENIQSVFEIAQGYHQPLIGHQLTFRYAKEESQFVRYVPFFLAIHLSEFSEIELHLGKRIKETVEILKEISESEFGDGYEQRNTAEKAIQVQKESGIIVLGNYDDPYKTELESVRNYLLEEDYHAFLLIELPDNQDMNWRDKLRIWTTTSRFCILVHREPSGANNEFEMLRNQETILAVLRPVDGGSTAMIPNNSERLGGSIEIFEFEDSPLEILDKSIKWAESMVEKT